MEGGRLQVRESPLCQAQSPLNEAQGTEPSHPSRRKQMLREAKGLAQGHRATGQNWKCTLILIFTPRGSLAAREGQHVSHLLLLGFGEFNTRRLPHTALFIHMKTSSENTLSSSGFTVPQRICEKNRPSTQPAGTSQRGPLQEM